MYSIMVSGHAVERDQDKEFRSGKMEENMRVTGRKTKEMAMEDVFTLMETYITASGKMIWVMV